MNILSSKLRTEFLACSALVRFDLSDLDNRLQPTLFVKANTLTLKYIIQSQLRLHFLPLGDRRLVYALEIDDDPTSPIALWSQMETDEEKTCLSSLLEDPLLHISLFNEPSANLAWCEVRLAGISSSVAAMIARSEPQLADPKLKAEIGPQLDLLSDPELQKGAINLPVNLKWQPVDVNYLTTGMRVSTLSLFDRDEGAQQEEVAVWIMDSLLGGIPAVRSPQVRLASGIRELTDVLVSHDKGAFLIESKTLSLLSRSELPNREKLSRGLRKHVVKAGKQLVGAATSIRQAIRITDAAGVELPVLARELLHAIILVPDLNLLADANDFGAEYFRRMTVSLGGGFFNILDPAELLSMVQMAEATSRRLGTVDQIAVLDGLLFFRATISLTKRTPDFRFRLRGSDEAPE